jgi:hypothetical protein
MIRFSGRVLVNTGQFVWKTCDPTFYYSRCEVSVATRYGEIESQKL